MIPKHIECGPENDNYRRLANYICIDHEDKILHNWFTGCVTEDDYETAISEVIATQNMNKRSRKEKTYHLMVSFRPEDNTRLTPEIFKEIEIRFAQTLGLEHHQRHCGVHANTGNIHMHIAYNLIHPQKYSRKAPYYDHRKIIKLARILEQEYGLQVDKGIEQVNDQKISARAAAMEAFSGKQSFESYCKEHKERIMNEIGLAQDWQSVHDIFAKYGMAVKPHGNGLVIQAQGKKKQNIKASALDRSLSKGKLEARLGPFVESKRELPPALARYEAKPLGDGIELARFERAKLEQQKALALIKAPYQERLAANKKKWQQKRLDYHMMPLTRKDRATLIRNSYELERNERKEIYTAMRAASKAARNSGFTLPEHRRNSKAKINELERHNSAAIQLPPEPKIPSPKLNQGFSR